MKVGYSLNKLVFGRDFSVPNLVGEEESENDAWCIGTQEARNY